MNLNEMIDEAFERYGNEIISKDYVDQQISSYTSVGDVPCEDYDDDDIERMFKELFED